VPIDLLVRSVSNLCCITFYRRGREAEGHWGSMQSRCVEVKHLQIMCILDELESKKKSLLPALMMQS